MSDPRSRGGALAATITLVSLGALGVLGTMGFNSGFGASGIGAPAATNHRKVERHETAAVMAEAGLDPQSLAAAGVSGAQCDGMFDAAFTYCIQADRFSQFQLAHKALNQARARAVDPTAQVDGDPRTVAQAQTAVENLQNAAFAFVTTALDQDTTATLRTIKANRRWGVPVKYLASDRTSQQWLTLRGALATKKVATMRHLSVPEAAAGTISTADANQAVSRAASSLSTNLAAVTASWNAHAPSSSPPHGSP